MNAKQYFSSRKGFTLIELLVVIGILAVLAAIAIPSVAGLIDRANVSADKTNANEMTNAIERFTSEYELYCQDIASGVIKDGDDNGVPDDMDAAQGRVFNVTGAVTRSDITDLEGASGLGNKQINRDTKYPTNMDTLKAIVENYTKTSSATFEPKQSDCSYWYSPSCGLVVVAETDATVDTLNSLVISGKDAKGNTLNNNAYWVNITTNTSVGENAIGGAVQGETPIKWGKLYVPTWDEDDTYLEDHRYVELQCDYFYKYANNRGSYCIVFLTFQVDYDDNGDMVLGGIVNVNDWGELWPCRYEGLKIIVEEVDNDTEWTMTVSEDGQHIGNRTVNPTLQWNFEEG